MMKYSIFLLFSTIVLIDGSPFYLNEEIAFQEEQKYEESIQPRIYRLTEHVQPLSYELRIIPDLIKFTFSGKVEINILIKFSTNQIQLHSQKLTIKSCSLKKDDKIYDNKFKLDEANDLLIIQASQLLTFDTKYTLIIEFEGILEDSMTGFYKSFYTAEDGEHWVATTQFEPTYARKAFPCFDEPHFRAPFTILVAHFPNQKAISNMPIDDILPADTAGSSGRRWTKFKQTPPMATYLVSFMVSDFIYMTDHEQKIRIWTRKNAVQHSSYALKQSTKLLNYLEGYTGISYKLPKLDVVAIPDFRSGAMENWGMTTYKEKYVIVDEKASAESQISRVTQVICHEFSHMWFGDLVTLAWWDFTWLNEGFARYFEYFAAAAVEPTWKLDQLFVIECVHVALWHEISTQRAMTTSVRTKQEIGRTFDVISYSKAASVIRMLEHILSPATFQSALHNYLKSGIEEHNGRVVPAYLFKALDEQAYRDSPPLPPHVSVSEVLKTWSENIGFPLIKVTRDHKTGTILIEQTTYKSPRAHKPAPDQEWIVPLTYTTKSEQKFSNTQPSLWSFAKKVVQLPHKVPDTDWVLFNLQHAGYYRVQYDENNWKLLTDQLNQDPIKIHVLNRAQLLDDSLSLASDGKLCYHIVLPLAQYLAQEYELIPWLSASRHLYAMYSTYEGTAFHKSVREFIRNIVAKPFEKLGFEIKPTDDHLTKVGKPQLSSLACMVGLDSCLTKALQEYEKNKNDLKKIQPDSKRLVYCVALKYSSNPENEFNNLWNEYLKSDIAYDKSTILQSLSCSNNRAVHEKLIKKLIDSKNKEIRKQNRYLILDTYSSNNEAADFALNYILNLVSKETALSELDDFGINTLEDVTRKIAVKQEVHVDMLEEIENKLNKRNQKKYQNLAKAAHRAYTKGRKSIKETKKKGEILEAHLQHLLHPHSSVPSQQTTQIPTTPPNSAAFTITSSLPRFITAAVIFHYGLSILYVL